jgi:hypothetical protein
MAIAGSTGEFSCLSINCLLNLAFLLFYLLVILFLRFLYAIADTSFSDRAMTFKFLSRSLLMCVGFALVLRLPPTPTL